MGHEHSILYGPVNALWHALQHTWPWDIPDHVINAAFVLLVCSIVFPLAARRLNRDNPGPFQQILELTVKGLKDMMNDIIGHGSERYLPVILGFATFIFISNFMGLFYFLAPPTANPNTTFALSISSFLYFNYQGIRSQGLLHYLKHFGGPIWWLFPLMFPIEIIGNLARMLSLSMRLFGNIFGEHTATGIFMGLIPILAPWPMMALGIFGAFLQTFVFIMLTMVYISLATSAEEH